MDILDFLHSKKWHYILADQMRVYPSKLMLAHTIVVISCFSTMIYAVILAL